MAKAKPTFTISGYSVWSVRRTIREAENVARWSPWTAHEWMQEARDRVSLENGLFDEYDAAVEKINALWRSYLKCRWYDPKSFWKRGSITMPITYLEPISQATSSRSIKDLFLVPSKF